MVPLARGKKGYHSGTVDTAGPGSRYLYRLDGVLERPDPASRFQPLGVHGPSQVVDTAFAWTDERWRGLPLKRCLFYELHTGTFTGQGTFDAIAARLDDLVELGVNAVELMPVAQFPGERNWGYDGVYPFAVQSSYGGPDGLMRLVDACHGRGLAVVLDVVYNHLGPEGNYLRDFGPYFSDLYRTPWGAPLNFDGPQSDEVRRYFIENALYWIDTCHIDALRLDAVHAILDFSARPFLQELAEAVQARALQLGRQVHLIAESALNDTRLIRSRELGGFGLDAQWNDDLHHALHGVLTGERQGYYCDFGDFDHLLKALRQGFVYDGQYSAFRRRRHGNRPHGIPAERFVVFAQNHDQVGNRLRGERLGDLVPLAALKMAAGVCLLSPYLPLIFMGEEYGEKAPFPYFISHSDPELIEAVRRGRREEFASFHWQGDPPDPQDEATFSGARLNHDLHRSPGPHQALREFYRHVITWRRRIEDAAGSEPAGWEVNGLPRRRVGWLRRRSGTLDVFIVFSASEGSVTARLPFPAGSWATAVDSSAVRWGGSGSAIPGRLDSDGEMRLELPPFCFLLFSRTHS
jgi:maltooligosyltrehalose trehalohydrolase